MQTSKPDHVVLVLPLGERKEQVRATVKAGAPCSPEGTTLKVVYPSHLMTEEPGFYRATWPAIGFGPMTLTRVDPATLSREVLSAFWAHIHRAPFHGVTTWDACLEASR